MQITMKGNKIELEGTDVDILEMIEALTQQLTNKAKAGIAYVVSKPVIITKSGSGDDNRPFAGAFRVHIAH